MLLADRHCYDALPDIDEAGFVTVLEAFPPSGEEAGLEGMLVRAGPDCRRFMYFGVAAVDLKFLDPGGLLKLGDIKSLHSNDYSYYKS